MFGAKCTDGVELGKWEIIDQIPQTLADLKISYFSFRHQAKLRPHLDLQNKDHHIHPTDLEFPKGTGRSRTRNWEHCNGERTIRMEERVEEFIIWRIIVIVHAGVGRNRCETTKNEFGPNM